MESPATTTPCLARVMEFELIDGRVRVVEEEWAKKVKEDRCQIGRNLDAATMAFNQLMRRYSEGVLNVPQDVQDLVVLCQSYRLEALQHKYRCALFVEHILDLRLVHLRCGRLEALPPSPSEIMWHVHTHPGGR